MNDSTDDALFWVALHTRIVDRIALGWMRGLLQRCARLEPTTSYSWPALRLVVEVPSGGAVDISLVRDHYRRAASSDKASGPIYDLVKGLEVVTVPL